jgi:hypothetical protein
MANLFVISSDLLAVDVEDIDLFSDLSYCPSCGSKIYCNNSCLTPSSMRRVYFRATVDYRNLSETYQYEFSHNYTEIGSYTVHVSMNEDSSYYETQNMVVNEGKYFFSIKIKLLVSN